MDMNVKPLRIKKYSRDESRETLQKYAIDIASGVGSELQDIDVLEYITCLEERDKYTFANLEKKIRRRIITDIRDKMYSTDAVKSSVCDIIKSSLESMSSDDIVKLASTFYEIDAEYVADAILFCVKKKLER